MHDPPIPNPNTDGLTNFLAPDSAVGGKDRRPNLKLMKSAMSVDQSNTNVFDRLLSHSTITSKRKEKPPVGHNDDIASGYSSSKGISDSYYTELENIDQSELLWNCDFSVENAHNGPIYSITTMENQLYTCSKKSLKIWDIDTINCISDIAASQGIIKSLWVMPEQKLLASAADKYIMLWDLVSLTNVATLKAHTEDINVLKRGGNMLVSAGSSGFDSSSLFLWDLRTSSPVEEREKSSDIQAVEVLDNNNECYIGNSSQMVKSIEFDNGPSVALSPPHEDSVTSLTKYQGIIVSGSRDKSIRFWDSTEKQLMYNCREAHKNGITCLASDDMYIYTGWKDNIVKSWQFKELSKDQYSELQVDKENSKDQDQSSMEELAHKYGRYKADVSSFMIGHTSQINCIWAMNNENNAILTGGNDRSLKLWTKN